MTSVHWSLESMTEQWYRQMAEPVTETKKVKILQRDLVIEHKRPGHQIL